MTLISNGAANQKLFQTGTTNEIDAAYAANFLQINGVAVNSAPYSVAMTKSGNDYVCTITSSTGFLDGAFTVSILPNVVENSEGNKLQASSQTFHVCIPVVTGISVNPTTMNHLAASALVTVTGKHLQYASSIEVSSSIDGKNHPISAKADGLSAEYLVSIPENTDYVNVLAHSFTPLLNGAGQTYTCSLTQNRKPSEVVFDVNGGDPTTTPGPIVQDMGTPVDISTYAPDATGEPSYRGFVFMEWELDDGTSAPVTSTMNPGVTRLKAKWLDLSKTMTSETVPDIVVKKDGSSKDAVEDLIGGQAEYTDANGVVHKPKVDYTWDDKVLTDSGVIVIRPYILDPKTGEPVYLEQVTYLYVLNDPYIYGTNYIVVFEGESVTRNNFSVFAVGEEVDILTKTIRKVFIPVTYHGDAVDTQTVGLYPATFTDYFGQNFNLRHDAQVKVMKRAGLSKEDELKAESSNFWVKVASIYHIAKPGETWEVTPDNYMDGGRLVSTDGIAEDAGYSYLVNATVGKYVYMNPVVLDQVRTSTAGGQVNGNLEGRQVSINHTDFATNPNRKFEPKGYFDLRMSAEKNEKVSVLVGERSQMQLHFEMNRAWMAEPYLTLKVSDELSSAAENGSTLYLFNYNAQINQLEMVGPMTPANNGNFRIQMKGIYGDYVILTGLPSEANYKITDKTNTLGTGILNDIGQNHVDSGKAKTIDEGLNIASVTRQNITSDEMFDSLTEYEAFTENKLSTEKSNKGLPIVLGSGSFIAICTGFYLWKKKKSS